MTPKRGGSFTSTIDPTSSQGAGSALCSATGGDGRLWKPLEGRGWPVGGDRGGACGQRGGSRAGLAVVSGGGLRAALGPEEDRGCRALLAVSSIEGWIRGRVAGTGDGCGAALLGAGSRGTLGSGLGLVTARGDRSDLHSVQQNT